MLSEDFLPSPTVGITKNDDKKDPFYWFLQSVPEVVEKNAVYLIEIHFFSCKFAATR